MKNSLNSLKSLLWLPLLALFALLSACGGGGGGSSATTTTTTPTTTTPTVLSIAITPASPTLAVGTTQQLVATATFSDGKVAALTTGVTWAAKGSVVSIVFTTGIVTGKTVGTDTVTASFANVNAAGTTVNTVVGTTDLTVRAPWAAVVAGGNQTIARKADGSLYGWGSNLIGQLGDSTTTDRNTPTQVSGGITTWRQVAMGDQFTLALRADGTLWAWGNNQNGQLGNGTSTTTPNPLPKQIGTATDWVTIAAGKSHALAINKTGLLYAWGRNFNGQLGDGTNIDRLVPTKIGTATNWFKVAGGDTHSLATRTDGSLYAWGGNSLGQVGNAGVIDQNAPVKIGGTTWVLVAAGANHSTAIRADATLWAWGSNSSGQVGTAASTATVTVPTQVGTSQNWLQVAGGIAHTVGVRTDGTLWTWGLNGNGQLGDGLGQDTNEPHQVGNSANWNSVAAGASHSFGLQSDGTLWGWGRNTEGQQGNSRFTDVPVPTNLP